MDPLENQHLSWQLVNDFGTNYGLGTEHYTVLMAQGSLQVSSDQHLSDSCVPVSEWENPTGVYAVNQNKVGWIQQFEHKDSVCNRTLVV